jgi:hypothetical protein
MYSPPTAIPCVTTPGGTIWGSMVVMADSTRT